MKEHIHFSPMGINTNCDCEDSNIIEMESKISINKVTVNGDEYYLNDKNTNKIRKVLKEMFFSQM